MDKPGYPCDQEYLVALVGRNDKIKKRENLIKFDTHETTTINEQFVFPKLC